MSRVLLIAALGLLSSGCLAFHSGPLPGEPTDARFTHLEGARVRYQVAGQGPAVVLLHGFAASLNTWKDVLPRLAKNHRVVALDLKGFGWTDRPEGDYSPQEQAKLVFALLDELGIDRAAVVGHSWGASVALAMALDSPKRIDRLVLYDAWAYAKQLPTFFIWARAGGLGEIMFSLFYEQRAEDRVSHAFHDQSYVTMELVDSVEEQLARPGTLAAALAAVRGQRYETMESKYKTIKHSTLLLWGREDQVTPLWVGERLSRELPKAKLLSYPGVGHFPMIEAKHASTRALIEFLAKEAR